MKNLKIILTAIFLIICFGFQLILGQIEIPPAGLNAITAEEMYAHVAYLADDKMLGRDTPSPQLDSCAVFIANYFKAHGLKSVENAAGYFQKVPLLKTNLTEIAKQKFLLTVSGITTKYEIKQDFVPLYLSANREITAPVIFAGYGITAPEYDYDDYAGIDARDKIVLVYSSEPQEKDSSSVFDGLNETDHAKLHHKVINAIDHGASGLIYVTQPGRRFRRPPNPWPSLMKNAPADAIPLTLGEKEENKIVVTQIGRNLAETLFSTAPQTMEAVYQNIDKMLQPQSFALPNVVVTVSVELAAEKFWTQNVVALWEGADPELRQEIVIIGGHYDHIGVSNDTTIFNGADDNASGTAGVMAVAKAFSACPQRPKRSVLFMTFAGEEKGLFGSRYYANTDPLLALDKTVAMINLDMIGRNDTSAVEVYGWSSSPELKDMLLTANAIVNMPFKLQDDKKMRGASDHMSFARKKIPNLFFFTGLHPDYHKSSDTAEKILPEKMAKIARLTFGIAWQLANMEGRPRFIENN